MGYFAEKRNCLASNKQSWKISGKSFWEICGKCSRIFISILIGPSGRFFDNLLR